MSSNIVAFVLAMSTLVGIEEIRLYALRRLRRKPVVNVIDDIVLPTPSDERWVRSLNGRSDDLDIANLKDRVEFNIGSITVTRRYNEYAAWLVHEYKVTIKGAQEYKGRRAKRYFLSVQKAYIERVAAAEYAE